MRLHKLPSVRHCEIADTIGLKHAPNFCKVPALRLFLADVLDHVVRNHDVESPIIERQMHIVY
jgi:hypothetical protein